MSSSTTSGTPEGGSESQSGGTATTASTPKPINPKMGTTEETYDGSGDYYYAFGGEPLPD